MNNFIKTNSSIVHNKLYKISDLSTTTISENKQKCPHCSSKFEQKYYYSNVESTNIIKSIEFTDLDLHLLSEHNMIKYNLYEAVCKISINFGLEFCLFKTNSINVLDAVYEEGSKQKYIESNKNIFNSKINRFSEHYGFIYFNNNKINKISILDDNRVDKGDPLIYQPVNSVEALKIDYMFHTHPKTPYIGSRVKYGMIYEFPSINDIIHFIDHHNNGKLIGSLIMTPEGIYMIHKYEFSREKIKIDYELLINELEKIYMECYYDSYDLYAKINFKKLLVNGWVKIPDDIFFTTISTNFEYINNINKVLIKYDLYIDYFPRIKLPKTDYWVLPDIYLPIL